MAGITCNSKQLGAKMMYLCHIPVTAPSKQSLSFVQTRPPEWLFEGDDKEEEEEGDVESRCTLSEAEHLTTAAQDRSAAAASMYLK